MKAFKKSVLAVCAVLFGTCLASCSDANEYEDNHTDNPSWVENYNDTMNVAHPETVAFTKWVRGSGIKTNVYGEDVQGFVESLDFVKEDSVAVKMSQGSTTGTFVDDSNTEYYPYYEYTYSPLTGKIEILKETKDDKGKVSKVSIFTAIAVEGTKNIITIAHFGDTPIQTYLVKQ